MQKIALIDNYDSFTYNIVDYLRKITNLDVTVIPYAQLNIEQLAPFDKIILSPGPELPKDFPKLFAVIQEYMSKKPILGICLGHQAIGQFFGAELAQLHPVVHGQERQMECCAPSILWQKLPKKFSVGLYHSWFISHHKLPEKITPLAYASGIIMAIGIQDLPIWGIQFHPESYISEHGLQILKNFIGYTCKIL